VADLSAAYRRSGQPPSLVVALAAALVLALGAAPAHAGPSQEATFQDDDLLVYASDARVTRTLSELRRLGVDRLRITMVWRNVAPANDQDAKPAGFDATNPDAYPRGAWDRWDRVVREARRRGMDVNFNLTTPAPDWATGSPARADIDPTYEPDAGEFGAFVRAAGRRYDGQNGRPLVRYWSLQNEPNQPGWLTPQWLQRGGQWVEQAPRIYRAMADAGYAALQATGHGGDTILVGETAPKGVSVRGETRAIDALRFIRRLYCLDDNLQVLSGAAADQHGCPAADQLDRFPREHPGLFRASGYAHHPYELTFAPNRPPSNRNWATMGNLPQLQSTLRRIHLRYNQPLRGDVPLFLTEFGYQSRPEDPLGVARTQQAAYLNHAEYIAWRNRDVRTLAQFLLRDDAAPVSRTFQSGLRTVRGARKPAWNAYRFPIHLARTTIPRGQRLRVWGLPRPARDGSRPRVRVEFRRTGSTRWRRLGTVRGDRRKGYVTASLRAPGQGRVRLRWNGLVSRSVPVRTAGGRTARSAARRAGSPRRRGPAAPRTGR
jgi:hypothetical protein